MYASKLVWLLLHLLQRKSVSFFITTPIIKPSYVLLDASITNEITTKNDERISIERVACRPRVLDLRVFRGFSISVSEYIQRQNLELNITTEDAVKQLTTSYDDNGKELDSIGDPVVQYIAVAFYQPDHELSLKEEYTNGVIGGIDAKIRRIQSSTPSTEQLEVPWPHVSLKNLNVSKNFRRMGVASALVREVEMFAREEKMEAVVLEVDPENTGAVSLYKKEGFVFVNEDEANYGKMILILE